MCSIECDTPVPCAAEVQQNDPDPPANPFPGTDVVTSGQSGEWCVVSHRWCWSSAARRILSIQVALILQVACRGQLVRFCLVGVHAALSGVPPLSCALCTCP